MLKHVPITFYVLFLTSFPIRERINCFNLKQSSDDCIIFGKRNFPIVLKSVSKLLLLFKFYGHYMLSSFYVYLYYSISSSWMWLCCYMSLLATTMVSSKRKQIFPTKKSPSKKAKKTTMPSKSITPSSSYYESSQAHSQHHQSHLYFCQCQLPWHLL